MIYTLVCVLSTTILGVLFKYSERYTARSVAFIPINYFICFFIGLLHSGPAIFQKYSVSWLPYSICLGSLFIIGFSYYAKTIQTAGLPLATLFQKMSIILTVIIAVLLGDRITYYQVLGLMLGFFSFFIILGIRKGQANQNYKYYGYLIGTLVISSCIEIIFISVEKRFTLPAELKLIFPSYLFLIAGILGILSLRINTSSFLINKSEIIFGILLGIPNFYSIFFMMMALNHEMSGAVFFPTLNCSVIIMSSLIGKYLFKEQLSRNQWTGITLSLISIFLIFYFKK